MSEDNTLKEFWKNVAKLASGSLISQIIAIALTPVIARIYSPEDYGVLSLINSVVGIVVIIASLRLERALVLVDSKKSNQLLSLCNAITMAFALFSLLVLFFLKNEINLILKIEPSFLIYLIPFLILINGVLNSFKAYGNSFKVYGLLTTSIVINSVLSAVLKLSGVWFFEPSAVLLVGAETLSVTITLIFVFLGLKYSNINYGFSFPKKPFIHATFIEQKQFLKFDIVSSLLNNFSWLMPAFLLSYYFDVAVVGYYSLGFTMLRLPMNLLGKAIGDVYYKTASDSVDDKELSENTLKIVIKLFGFGLLPIFFITLFGDQLFVLVFGIKWEQAGVYSQILSLWTLMWFVASPISNIYYIKNIQNKLFNFTVISLVARALSLVIGGIYGNVILAISLFSLTSFLLYLFQLLYLLQKVNVSLTSLVTHLIQDIKFAFVVMFLLVFLYFCPINFKITLAVGIFLILGFYAMKLKGLKAKI